MPVQSVESEDSPFSAYMPHDGTYPYLEEFIFLIYSDPDLDDDTVEYAKQEYDRWVAGIDYNFIVIDDTGHLVIDYEIAEAEGVANIW